MVSSFSFVSDGATSAHESPYVRHRLYEYGSQYFDYTNQKAFPDCEARRIFERIATGKSRSGGSSKRSGADGDKRDKKKRKDRR